MATNKSKPDAATCEMLFKLMTLARDVHLADAQVRSICEMVTPANVQHTANLVRRLNTNQPKNQPAVVAPSRTSASTKQSTQASSEAGAVICADTFHHLCDEDILQLKKLTKVCPFSLASQSCIRGKKCELLRICLNDNCDRGKQCRGSHNFVRTCESVLLSKPCPKRVHNKNACARNHHYKVRLFMSAMRKSHEVGFYGVAVAAPTLRLSPVLQLDVKPKIAVVKGMVQEIVQETEEELTDSDDGSVSEQDEDTIDDLAESITDLAMGVMLR